MSSINDCKVNVLIPAYNVELYIEKCLDSLIQQTLKEISITVLDDGSTDKTGEILDIYAREYKNIRVFHQSNSGIVKARSTLMKMAHGEYIGWVDADDFVKPTMFELLYNEAKSVDADVVFCDYLFYPKEIPTKIKWYKPYNGIVDCFFLSRNTQHWNKIIKFDMIKKCELIKWNDYCGEISYALTFILAKRIISVDNELYYYRVGQKSLSNSFKNTKWYEENVSKTIRFQDAIHSYNLDAKWREYYDSSIAISSIHAMIVMAYNGKKKEYNKYKDFYFKRRKNRFIKMRINESYGALKSFVMRKIIPTSYYIAKAISNISLSG